MSKIFEWKGHKFTIKAMPYVSPLEARKECKNCGGTGKVGADNYYYDFVECTKCLGRGLERIDFPDPVMDLKLCKYLNECLDEYLKDKVFVSK